MESAATRLAPEMVQERYRFTITVSTRSVLTGVAPMQYVLESVIPDCTGLGRFKTEDAADGLRIWVQLAFLQAVEGIRRHAATLHWILDQQLASIEDMFGHLKEAMGEDLDFDEESLSGDRDIDAAGGAVPYIQGSIREMVEEFAGNRDQFIENLWLPSLEGKLPVRFADPSLGAEWLRAPIFLVDEPEQHLHPRAQRDLARWLADLGRTNRSQTLIITHTVPFIDQADTIVYVRRDTAGRAKVTASTEDITALNEIAGDLGLNRGELLTGISLFLFVEGVSDKHVLEGMFGDRLRRCGVAVVPLHGVRQLRQILDATVLLHFSTAKTAVLVDSLDEHEIAAMLADSVRLEAARHSPKIEERELANLLREAADQGRPAEPLGLPKHDIFFLLDPAAIQETWDELRTTKADYAPSASTGKATTPYPGLDRFWAEYSSSKRDEHWKVFCERRYGMLSVKEGVNWYLIAAERTRLNGRIPAELSGIIDRVVKLAGQVYE